VLNYCGHFEAASHATVNLTIKNGNTSQS